MAKNKIGLQFAGWEQLLSGIEKAAGEEGLKQAAEAGLKASKAYINKQVDSIMVKSNMPAGGKYWGEGKTKKSLDKNFSVNWAGFTGEIEIGFSFDKSGATSLYLMHGTPRHKPPMNKVSGLYDAFYGKKTVVAIKHLQREAIEKWIKRNL